jgi:hypothetical protein
VVVVTSKTPTPLEPGLVVLLPPKAATRPGHHTQPGTVHMTQRKIIVKAQGPQARATFTMTACRGRVWITTYDCPFICVAIFETAQADSLVELINQTTKEARGYTP